MKSSKNNDFDEIVYNYLTMAKVEVVEKKENRLLGTILRIGAVIGGAYLLFALHPTLSFVAENASGEIFRGIKGAIRYNGAEHGLTLGVRVGNGSVGLEARR